MTSRSYRRGDPGQSTVELALVLPAVVLVILLVVQVGQVVRDRVMVVHVARETARSAAVSPDAPGAAEVAERHGLEPGRLQVELDTPEDGFVTATIGYEAPTDVALVGAVLPDVSLHAEASMLTEWQTRR